VIGQHHLKADQRQTNQHLAFSVIKSAISEPLRQAADTWIVDDILTSGATARSAMGALQNAGWPVAGLVCLGRTPRRGPSTERRDLRSGCRADNAPG